MAFVVFVPVRMCPLVNAGFVIAIGTITSNGVINPSSSFVVVIHHNVNIFFSLPLLSLLILILFSFLMQLEYGKLFL